MKRQLPSWLIFDVGQMKAFLFLLTGAAAFAADAAARTSEVLLFSSEDYRFSITAWEMGAPDERGQREVTFAVEYEIRKNAPYRLLVSPVMGVVFIGGSSFSASCDHPRGVSRFRFLGIGDTPSQFISLHRNDDLSLAGRLLAWSALNFPLRRPPFK